MSLCVARNPPLAVSLNAPWLPPFQGHSFGTICVAESFRHLQCPPEKPHPTHSESAPKGVDEMEPTTLLFLTLVVLLIFAVGCYGLGRWYYSRPDVRRC